MREELVGPRSAALVLSARERLNESSHVAGDGELTRGEERMDRRKAGVEAERRADRGGVMERSCACGIARLAALRAFA
jgi:hypothetical protein